MNGCPAFVFVGVWRADSGPALEQAALGFCGQTGMFSPGTKVNGRADASMTFSIVAWHPSADGRSSSFRPVENKPARPRAELGCSEGGGSQNRTGGPRIGPEELESDRRT